MARGAFIIERRERFRSQLHERDARAKTGQLMGLEALRGLPAVGVVLEHGALAESVRARGRGAVVRAVRAALEEARRRLRGGMNRRNSQQSRGRAQ